MTFYLWLILSILLRNPILALLIIVAFLWATDRFTLRVLPSPRQWLRRRRHIDRLRSTLEVNPHDRPARFELAELLLVKKKFADALELLEANLEREKGARTLFAAGKAAFGTVAPDATSKGEAYLAAAREIDPRFRLGDIDLELGRGRLRHGDLQGARDRYYRDYMLADFTLDLRRAPMSEIQRALDLPNVALARGRVNQVGLIDLPGGSRPLQCSAISLPMEASHKHVNDILLVSGAWFSSPTAKECILNSAFAEARGIEPGDRLTVRLLGTRHELLVRGTAMSPEFVWLLPPGADWRLIRPTSRCCTAPCRSSRRPASSRARSTSWSGWRTTAASSSCSRRWR